MCVFVCVCVCLCVCVCVVFIAVDFNDCVSGAATATDSIAAGVRVILMLNQIERGRKATVQDISMLML